MKKCPKCNKVFDVKDAKYCPYDRTLLVECDKQCPECGRIYDDEYNFCLIDGTPLAYMKVIKTFIGHTDEVLTVDFSPDGKMIISGSKDNTIKLWNIVTAKEIRTKKSQHHNIF